MIQLFKNKSLKNNTKTGQGAGVRTVGGMAGARGAGVGMSAQGAGVGAGAQEAGNKNAKKQRGRSMVEMLGVLAIIGVLSIGGIQGYTMAMRRYRANEILNIVQKYATVIYSSCQQEMINNPAVYNEGGWIMSGAGINSWNFWRCSGIKFTDAGLGALPQGVLYIGMWDIRSLSSGDAVVISVQFETKELCETTMGITGKPIADEAARGMLYVGDHMYGDDVIDYTCGTTPFDDDKNIYLSIVTMMN